MLLAGVFIVLDLYFTIETYKGLSKKKYKKAKTLYIILSGIFYLMSLGYIGLYCYLLHNGICINESLLIFIKFMVVISFLFDMSLKLSIYSSIKKAIKSKYKKSKS